MSNDDHDGEWDEKSDLTRIEDLSEFLHEEDPDVDARLSSATEEENSSFSEDSTLPDLPIPEELSSLEDLPGDSSQEDEEPESSFEEESSWGEEESFEEEDSFTDEDDDNSFDNGDDFEDNLEEDQDQQSEEDLEEDQDEQSWGEEQTFEDDQNFEDEEEELPPPPEEENGEDSFEETSFESEENQLEEPQFEEAQFKEDQYEEDQEEAPASTAFQEQKEQDSYTPAASVAPQARENFQDLRDFGNAITYGVVTAGGNPPFSLILRSVKYEEDAEDIKILLREHGLLNDENEKTIDQGLEQGSLLISQISEYSAIYLAHKMRRFDVEIRIGLSDQLHPSKSYEREGKGLISKSNLRQNKEEHMEIEAYALDIEDIKMVISSQIEGYTIKRYIEIISSHALVKETDLYRHTFTQGENDEDDLLLRNLLKQFPEELSENSVKDLGLNEVYQKLVDDLRNEAYKLEANATVGINFTITPLPSSEDLPQMPRYKITATGNAVWIIDQPY